eukprot:3567801-Pyramimonas_sp.AAC.2
MFTAPKREPQFENHPPSICVTGSPNDPPREWASTTSSPLGPPVRCRPPASRPILPAPLRPQRNCTAGKTKALESPP